MTSKEALKLAILEYEKDLETDENNQWVKNVLKGLKECQQDLEVLEILKRKSVDIHLIKDIMIDNIRFNYYPYDNLTNKEFNKIKEWIENDK